jgi:hypothetical protein
VSVGLSLARPLSLVALLLSIALAGCSGGGDADDAADALSQTSTGPSLAAVIKVLVAGNASSAVAGVVPAESGVELTFDGSGSTGPIVSFAWDFGDNGTGSDETETHTYAAGGLYDVTLTVAGIGNTSARATVRLDVAADPVGQFLFTAVHPIEGELPVMNPNSCTNQDVDCKDHVVPIVAVDANGTPALAKTVRIVLTGSSPLPAGDLQVFWRDPAGTELNSTDASGFEHNLQYSGDMAAGDYVLRIRVFTGAQVSYTGSVEVDYVHA